jgi:hypothetical protein
MNGLQMDGVTIHYQSFDLGAWANDVIIEDRKAKFSESQYGIADTAMHVNQEKLKIEEIEIFPLIFKREIHVKTMWLKNPVVRFERNLKSVPSKIRR